MKITEVTCQICGDRAKAFRVAPKPEGVLSAREIWYACSLHKTNEYRELDLSKDQAPVCEHCGTDRDVTWFPGMTAYVEPKPTIWDHLRGELPVSPNRDIAYCQRCGSEHIEFWQNQWDEYYSSSR